ncbi:MULTISPECIES: Gp15 family bacteriophage protein [unclassified Streptococcus]|uniref:Gp15 family bacteriophage protein n=1 Tax=unclassified Streptococcus TaxID=2608887 RepID=UPI001072935D|nr:MULTISPECIES: Gp15 family bacteriophage protein [unclassified Streptococcus]MBF0788161.1 hypothetical protein [Streptococcus sp. 19428wC2_LYSM12]MCQ9212286.1 bacteriophage Gp15 family protein [Streptococcus sp. B01]MCQ9213617.1 bacteriophage Gp15 family protein [Streptococcus sp. O1]TFV04762.1 hypothetical protein E4T79_09760 [Streptococcus sp. LYSM12]
MKLNDPLETEFEFEGHTYSLNLAFNRVLDVFDCIRDDVLSDIEKAIVCVEIITGESVVEFPLVVDLWIYIKENFIDLADDEPEQLDLHGNPMPKAQKSDDLVRLVDFEKDAEYIYASFLQAYGISLLQEQDRLSWIEFGALLNALPDNTIMQRIIEIRSWKPKKGESPEYRQDMRKLKAKYSLEEYREEEDYGG